MNNKFITWNVLVAFTFVSILLHFPAPTTMVYAQTITTSSLRPVNTTTVTDSKFSFKKDLIFGDTDADVKELQKVLNSTVDTMVSTEGPGSPGQESSYFGSLTKTAVIKFQKKYDITPADGNVGKITRTQLNLLIGVLVTTDSIGSPQNRAGTSINSSVSTTCNFVLGNFSFI